MAILLASLLLVAEVVSRLTFSLLKVAGGSVAQLRERKENIASGRIEGGEEAASAARQLTAGVAPHPFLGIVQTPRPVNRQWTLVHHLPINEFGFIDDKTPLQRRSESRRIVAITGGSVAFFLASEGVARLEERLQTVPEFSGREIVFVRLAFGGFKEPQQLATLAYLLALGGEFDLLINLDGFNEMALYPAEGAPLSAHPAHPRGWSYILEATTSPDRLTALGARAFWSRRRTQWARVLSGPLFGRSALATLAWRLGDRWLSSRVEVAEASFRFSMQSGQLGFAAIGPRTEFAHREAMLTALAALWERSSLQLAHLCRSNGIRYFHFLQPNQYLEGSKPMGSEERTIAISSESPYGASIASGYPLLIEAGARLHSAGVDFTDLSQMFSHVEAPIYVDSCCHLNSDGNLLLADAIAERISAASTSPSPTTLPNAAF